MFMDIGTSSKPANIRRFLLRVRGNNLSFEGQPQREASSCKHGAGDSDTH